MGETAESFWIALEVENNRWNGFVRALRKPDREAFDELIYAFRSYASEINNANNPRVFEPMVISILLGLQKRLLKLEKELKVFEKIQQELSRDQAKKNLSCSE
jgi:hypothetical protein